MDKRINEGLAEVCEMLASYEEATPKQKDEFLRYAKIFRTLGDISKKQKEVIIKMGKKLTDKEIRAREVSKVVLKIRRLEKQHKEDIVKSACAKYSLAITDRRTAERDIKIAERRLAEAQRRLR